MLEYLFSNVSESRVITQQNMNEFSIKIKFNTLYVIILKVRNWWSNAYYLKENIVDERETKKL